MALLILLTFLSVVSLLMLGVIFYAYTKARAFASDAKSTIEDVNEAFQAFFQVDGEDNSSPFSRLTGSLSQVLAAEIAGTMVAAINGSFGGMTKGLNAELEQAAIEGNPKLAIIKMLPKSTQKNGLAMAGVEIFGDKIIEAIQNMGKNGKAKTTTGGDSSRPRFKL